MAKKGREEYKGVPMDYKELGNTMFHQTLNMIQHAEGLDLMSMGRINRVVKAALHQLDKMQKVYTDTVKAPFDEKLKALGIEWDGEAGDEPPELTDEQTESFKKWQAEKEAAIEEFQKTSVHVDCVPLGPQHLKEIKTLSPARLASLCGLFDAEGTVREKALSRKLGVVR